MIVIILHGSQGDTVALVGSTAGLARAGTAFTEVDPADSECLISGNPDLKADLQKIFGDVAALFGMRVV